MKKTNYKFLLTALVIMSIFITLSTISATDNVSSDNAQLTTSDDITQLQSEQINTDIKKTNTENKDIQKEISTKKNNKINNTNNQKTTKKDTYSVNNYQELYNKVEDIKSNSQNTEETITLNKGTYTITNPINWGNTTQTTKKLTIKGNGQVIDGKGVKNFISVKNDYILNLENIIIQNTNASNGSAVSTNNATVNIQNSQFNNNNASMGGAIHNYNRSSITITNTTFNNNNAKSGGAIYNRFANLTVTNVTATQNNATWGGFVYNAYNGDVRLINSQFNKNNASIGGVSYTALTSRTKVSNSNFTENTANSYAGAIYVQNSNATVENSNFNKGTSKYGGSLYMDGGIVTITNSNFTEDQAKAGSGGSLYATGSNVKLTVSNSNFKDCTSDMGGAIYTNTNGLVVENSNFKNCIDNKYNTTIYTFQGLTLKNSTIIADIATVNAGEQVTITAPVNDRTLSENELITFNVEGKDYTTTKTGIAIIYNTTFTKGGNQVVTVSFPSQPGNTMTLNYNVIKTGEFNVTGYEELYNKVEEIKANNEYTEVTINLKSGDYSITNPINWGNTTHTTKTITIKGNNQVIDGKKVKNFISVKNDYTLNLENIIIQNTNASNGSAVSTNNATVNIQNSQFNNNNASMGGAIHNYNRSTITITNTTFNNNNAKSGGAIYNRFANLTVTNVTATKNNATWGGFVYNAYNGDVRLIDSQFKNNNASIGGVSYTTLTSRTKVSNSNFTENTADSYAGAIYVQNSNATVENSNFNKGTSKYGGSLYMDGGVVTITNSNFTEDQAKAGSGGSLYATGFNVKLTVSNSNFKDCTSDMAGAIYTNTNGLVVENSYFENCIDNRYNTTIYTFKGLTLKNSTIIADIATVNAGEQITITAPVNDRTLSEDELITFNVEGKDYTTTKTGIAIIYNTTFTKGGNQVITVSFPSQPGNTMTLNYNVIKTGEFNVTGYEELYNKVEEIKANNEYTEVTIKLNPGNYSITNPINWGNTTHTTKKLTIKGNGQVIDGNNTKNFISITNGYTLNIENITAQNCYGLNGSVINNINSTVTIQDSIFNNNTAKNYGGVIYNGHANTTVIDSKASKNNATNGGFVYNNHNGNVTIITSTFNNNNASLGGVTFDNSLSTTTIMNSNFTNNNATYSGGVNYVSNASCVIKNSNYNNNTAKNGGAIFNTNKGSIDITKSNFTDNHANMGAFIYTNNAPLSIKDSILLNNVDDKNNYTMYLFNNITMKNTTIINDMGEVSKTTIVTINSPVYLRSLGDYDKAVFTVNGKTYTVYKQGGVRSIIQLNTTFNTFGDNIVAIAYDVLPGNTIQLVYHIKDVVENITVDDINISSLKNGTITAIVTDVNGHSIKGELPATITINNKTYDTIIKNGLLNANIPTDTLKAGEYDVIIDIPETENSTHAQVTHSLSIIKRATQNMTLDDVTIKTMNNHTITITLNDVDGNMVQSNLPVAVKINGVTQKHITTNGNLLNITLDTDDFRAGVYNISIKLGENGYYTGSELVQKLTIEKRTPTISIKTNTPKTQDTLEAEIRITEDNTLVDGGFVIFKINGVTLKDETGNTVRANVENGFAYLNYKLPSNIGSGNYTISVVYNSPFHETIRTTENLTIEKQIVENKTLETILTQKGENTTISLNIADITGKQLVGNTKIAVKLNGKTQISQTISNGKLDISIPTDTFSNKNYTLTIILGANALYDKAVYNGMITIVNPREMPAYIENENLTVLE